MSRASEVRPRVFNGHLANCKSCGVVITTKTKGAIHFRAKNFQCGSCYLKTKSEQRKQMGLW